MKERTPDEQILKYLADVHSIEEQALTQMRRAPELAGDGEIARAFEEHLSETEGHEARVAQRLKDLGGSASKVKDTAGKAGGVGMLLFAKSQPDTPGKLVAHAYAYEHMEFAAYELLRRIADRVGDPETAALASAIAPEEERMAQRLASCFDRAVEASLRDLDPDDLDAQLNKYLADAHAIENQAVGLLDKGQKIAGDGRLAVFYSKHLHETREQQARIEERLQARGSAPSALKDAALRVGALNLGAFFAAQPDTPAKLAGFAFAFEHLEIGAYEQLRRVAEWAGDSETAKAAATILAQERSAAGEIAAGWDAAVDVSLDALGVA
jgi:ferritin-like metal-binding protein YciE